MHVLSSRRVIALCLVVVAALLVGAVGAVGAHPPAEPAHGVNETTHHTLWSGDDDVLNESELNDRLNDSESDLEALAAMTDIPLNEPPRAVEEWNRGDLEEFPRTGVDRSVYPSDAALANGRFIKDAYASVFAVQPSTRARLSPSRQPLFVAQNGVLLGTTDFRIRIPENRNGPNRSVRWSLEDYDFETSLLIDGQLESSDRTDHSVSLPYRLDSYGGASHTLTIRTDIQAELRKRVRTCTAWNNESDCIDWKTSIKHPEERRTVTETVDVVAYDISVSGFRTRYPNGDLGLVVYKNQPWLGYSLPDGDVRGVWRFYSARDGDWDRLTVSKEGSRVTKHSSLHPLQLNAYPIETGPTAVPHEKVSILETIGTQTQSPTLPPEIVLDRLEGTYTASHEIVSRVSLSGANSRLNELTAYGLVRGVKAEPPIANFVEIPFYQTNLTLSVVNTTDETVTVRIELSENRSGKPITTVTRDGHVFLNGERVETYYDGSVTETFERQGGTISARFEPGNWWEKRPGYASSSDTVYVGGTSLQVLSLLYQAIVPVTLVLVSIFLVSRITGWEVWPPWRRL